MLNTCVKTKKKNIRDTCHHLIVKIIHRFRFEVLLLLLQSLLTIMGGVSCARNEQENRRSRYQKCEQQRIRHDAQNREKEQKWVRRKLLRTIFLSRRADEKEKGVILKMEHRQKILLKKLAAKEKKNSFICTSAFYSFKLLSIVMSFSFLVYISVIRLISLYIEQHPHEKKNEKMKRAVLSRPFKVILLCLAFIAVISFWSRNATLAEDYESVAFQERSMILSLQSEKNQLIDSGNFKYDIYSSGYHDDSENLKYDIYSSGYHDTEECLFLSVSVRNFINFEQTNELYLFEIKWHFSYGYCDMMYSKWLLQYLMKPGSKKWRRRRQRFLENFHDHFIWITKFIYLFRELWNLSPVSWDKNMTILLRMILFSSNTFLHFMVVRSTICYMIQGVYIFGLFAILLKRILLSLSYGILLRLFKRSLVMFRCVLFLCFGLQFLIVSFLCGYNARDFSARFGYTGRVRGSGCRMKMIRHFFGNCQKYFDRSVVEYKKMCLIYGFKCELPSSANCVIDALALGLFYLNSKPFEFILKHLRHNLSRSQHN